MALYVFARSPKYRRLRMTKSVVFLNAQDFLFSFMCIFQCFLAFVNNSIYGREGGCATQAIYITFLAMATSHTLAIMAYMNQQNLEHRTVYSYRDVLKMHACTWSVDAVITVLLTVYPGRVIVQSGGTYCMPELTKAWSWILLFGIGVGSALAVMVHRFYLIWRMLDKHAASVDRAGTSLATAASRAHAQARTMAGRILLLLAIFITCSSVFLVASFYELVSGNLVPGWVMVLAGFAIHGNSFFNPLLSIGMSGTASEEAARVLGCCACVRARLATRGASSGTGTTTKTDRTTKSTSDPCSKTACSGAAAAGSPRIAGHKRTASNAMPAVPTPARAGAGAAADTEMVALDLPKMPPPAGGRLRVATSGGPHDEEQRLRQPVTPNVEDPPGACRANTGRRGLGLQQSVGPSSAPSSPGPV